MELFMLERISSYNLNLDKNTHLIHHRFVTSTPLMSKKDEKKFKKSQAYIHIYITLSLLNDLTSFVLIIWHFGINSLINYIIALAYNWIICCAYLLPHLLFPCISLYFSRLCLLVKTFQSTPMYIVMVIFVYQFSLKTGPQPSLYSQFV